MKEFKLHLNLLEEKENIINNKKAIESLKEYSGNIYVLSNYVFEIINNILSFTKKQINIHEELIRERKLTYEKYLKNVLNIRLSMSNIFQKKKKAYI